MYQIYSPLNPDPFRNSNLIFTMSASEGFLRKVPKMNWSTLLRRSWWPAAVGELELELELELLLPSSLLFWFEANPLKVGTDQPKRLLLDTLLARSQNHGERSTKGLVAARQHRTVE